MKNLKANRTKTALMLISQAKRCILLSGTPALSRPFELFPQIKALEPKAFSGYYEPFLIIFAFNLKIKDLLIEWMRLNVCINIPESVLETASFDDGISCRSIKNLIFG